MALWKDPSVKEVTPPTRDTPVREADAAFDRVVEKTNLERVLPQTPVETARKLGISRNTIYRALRA